jgi:hypothetical protein
MSEPTFKRGWKTLLDGTRIPITEDEGKQLWQMIQDQEARQAAAYPTTQSALRAYIDADSRMKALGWTGTIFNLEDGAEVAIAERGSTGIFRGIWHKPYLYYQDCVSHMGKNFIKRVEDLTPDEAAKMEECEADHRSFMANQTKSLQGLQNLLDGDEE